MTRPCLGIDLIGPALTDAQSIDWRTFREVMHWQGPDCCPPEDQAARAAMVIGRVSLHIAAAPGLFVRPDTYDLNEPRKLPFVKLGILDCDQTGEIIIDPDQTIAVFGRQLSVRVLASVDPLWKKTDPAGPIEGSWSANLKVKICPLFCCPDWPPVLTESHTVAPDATVTRTIPRSARSVTISEGTGAAMTVRWTNGAGGPLVDQTVVAANTTVFVPVVAGATHFSIVAVAVVTRAAALRWEIAP